MEAVVAAIDRQRLLASLTAQDRMYLRRDFADLITTIDKRFKEPGGNFPHLRRLVRIVAVADNPELTGSGWPGRLRPQDTTITAAARRVCQR